MEAKEYLKQVMVIEARLRLIDKTIAKIKSELKRLADVSLKASWPDGQPHGTITTDPTGSEAIKLADSYSARRKELRKKLLDYEYEQLKTKSELWQKQIEIIDTIGHVTDPVLYNILSLRYIENKSFEWIAVEIGYTWRHTIRLHGDALEEVQKLIDRKEVESK